MPPDNSVTVGGDPHREGIVPLGVGEGWAASRHALRSGAELTSLVVAEGAVEVRAHLVSGAAPGTAVQVTGWAPAEGGNERAELVGVYGLTGDSTLSGTVGAGPTLFVALARLTAEHNPLALAESVSVEVKGATADDSHDVHDLTVRWSSGSEQRFRFGRTAPAEGSATAPWSVTPR